MSAPWSRVLLPALALLGAALVLLAALATTSVPGDGLSPRAGSTLTLAADAELTWIFTTERARLNGLRLWLDRPVSDGAELVVTIGETTLPGLALAETVVPLAATDADGAIEIGFGPLRAASSPHVPTTTIQIQLRPLGLAPGTGVTLRGGDVPPDEGQIPAFTPLYQIRPFDAVWPISLMADGRPGLLGWPPLYALLPYGFLVVLLRTLRLVTRAGEVEPPPRD